MRAQPVSLPRTLLVNVVLNQISKVLTHDGVPFVEPDSKVGVGFLDLGDHRFRNGSVELGEGVELHVDGT